MFGKLKVTSKMSINAMANEIAEIANSISSTECLDYFNRVGDFSIPVTKRPEKLSVPQDRRDLSELTDLINSDANCVPLTLGDSLETITKLVEGDDELSIYGAIWVSSKDSNVRLNILHPIVADQLIRGVHANLMEEPGKVYIYAYRSSTKLSIDGEFVDGTIASWLGVINSIRESSYKPSIKTKNSSNVKNLINDYRQGRKGIDEIQFDLREERGKMPEEVISPLCYLTRGVLYPYYGALLSHFSSSTYRSRDLLRFGSCNVSHSDDIGSWGTTCTGSHSSSIYKSLFVMCNLNTGSPYHTDVIACSSNKEMRLYVKCAQDLAVSILKGDF